MALSAGGRRMATCSELNPDHDVPNIPTAPFDQPCVASQAMTCSMSSCSCTVYSSVAMPSDEPVPRMSSRHTTYPNSAARRSYSGL